MTYIFHPDDPRGTRGLLGGKAAALAALQGAGFPVPPFFVITPAACAAGVLSVESPLDAGAVPAAHEPGTEPYPSAGVRAELDHALAVLCPSGEAVAVRSSATDEDGAAHSFAGQLDSYLDVVPADVAGRVAAVWRSSLAPRVRAYRREHGLDDAPHVPAVLVQRMVAAEASGVAFSADPVSGRRGIAVVAAVRGSGAALVSGAVDADAYHVDRTERIVARQSPRPQPPASAHEAPLHVGRLSFPAHGRRGGEGRPVLGDDMARSVARLARRCERLFGRPQDIEWAIENGRLYILQARPITGLARVADPDGAYALWDNSNIAESYGGVTTPLTFSFARHAYAAVYRELGRILGLPASAIRAHDDTFEHMLGLVEGRVYYNLLNWYRLLALLPGFRVNRGFMEGMMGVGEGLQADVMAAAAPTTWRERLGDGLHLLRAVAGLGAAYALLPRRVADFYARLDCALGPASPDLDAMRPDELVSYYDDLARELLAHWDAPLVNDLWAMIFYGLLCRLNARWCGDTAGTLQNGLLCGEGGMISSEPAARVRSMAGLAAPHEELVAALSAGDLAEVRRMMARLPLFEKEYDAYLARFAERCPDELKLESPTLRDDPLPLLRAIGGTAKRLRGDTSDGAHGTAGVPPTPAAASDNNPTISISIEARLRRDAERRVDAALAGHPARRAVFRWVLGNARTRVRDRENLRFERTRVFGRVRLIVLALGRAFHALGLLDDPRDVFYLEIEEIRGYVKGTASCTSLRGLTALRKEEFERYKTSAAPDRRFATRGAVYAGNTFRGAESASSAEPVGAAGGDRRVGLGCCPGVVRGPVRVVVDPGDARVRPGEILVAECTDPGWIMLFPLAAGVLVERGSALSHSAIVARELGIPTVVALDDATRWLRDGDWVELDGASGAVAKIPAPGGAARPAESTVSNCHQREALHV